MAPNREAATTMDGSDVVGDWLLLDAMRMVVGNATSVALHHGDGWGQRGL